MLEAAAAILRFGQYVLLLGLFGALAHRVYAGGSAAPPGRLVAAVATGALLVAALALAVQAAQMAGDLAAAWDLPTLQAVVVDMAVGRAWLFRSAALAGLIAVALLGRLGRGWAAALAGAAVASLAWSGHGAAGDGPAGAVRLLSTVIHLLAAGLWFGALLLFARDLLRPRAHPAATHADLAGFAGVGSLCAALLVATGLIAAVALNGADPRGLFEHAWGQLLLIKLGLFLLMLALAAANRFALVPALRKTLDRPDASAGVLKRLRLSLFAETAAALAILALVARLGALSPAP